MTTTKGGAVAKTADGNGSSYTAREAQRAEAERALPSMAPAEHFTFTADDGRSFTSTRTVTEVITPGLLRTHRSNEMEFAFVSLERMFGDNEEAMAAIDESWSCLGRVTRDLQPFIERAVRVGLGE